MSFTAIFKTPVKIEELQQLGEIVFINDNFWLKTPKNFALMLEKDEEFCYSLTSFGSAGDKGEFLDKITKVHQLISEYEYEY